MPRIVGVVQLGKTAFLKSLTPYYVQAKEQDKLDPFFDNLIIVWFDRYPIEEFCDPFFRGDPDYHEWATVHTKSDLRKQLTNLARWSTLRVPESSNWEDEVTVEKMGRTAMVGTSSPATKSRRGRTLTRK